MFSISICKFILCHYEYALLPWPFVREITVVGNTWENILNFPLGASNSQSHCRSSKDIKFQTAAIFKADSCMGMIPVCYTEVLRLGAASGVAFINGCSFCLPPLLSLADDHSRVRLQMLEGDNNSDYINGNYIDVCILKQSTHWTFQHVPHTRHSHMCHTPDILTHATHEICFAAVDVCQWPSTASVAPPPHSTECTHCQLKLAHLRINILFPPYTPFTYPHYMS